MSATGTNDGATTAGDDEQPTVVGDPGASMSSTVDAIRDGSMLGRYAVLERLGSGAMGIVLRAYDPKLHREVALKLVRPGSGARAKASQARLLREAQALARLNHPHVVSVYDVDTTEHGVVIAMEYVEGRTLRAWRKERPRSWSEVLEVMLAAARGLASAHTADLVHRDIKPDNILVGEGASDRLATGRVRVTDFGLARARTIYEPSDDRHELSAEAPTDDLLTQVGTVMGTPGYMAPEQHAGAIADARADQYALCVTMWEALHGARPFSGNDMKSLAEAKHRGPPASPGGSVPRWLHGILARGLAVQPEARWPSLDALADALASGSTRARRRRAGWSLVGVGLLGLGWVGAREISQRRAVASCEEASATAVRTTWSEDAQARLEAGMLGSRLSYAATTHERVLAWIEPWVDEWESMHRATCIAADVERRWDPERAARARQCFEEGLLHLSALVEVLAEGRRESIPRAVAAVSALPNVKLCTDEAVLARRPRLPDDPAVRERAAAIQLELLRARGLGSAGRPGDALELGRTVVEAAAAEKLLSLELEAELATGLFAEQAGAYAEAEQRLRSALVRAGEAGFDEIAADAALGLVHVVGVALSRHDAGLAYADTATILVQRLHETEDNPRQMRLFTNRANLHGQRDEPDSARRLHEQALAVAETIYGPEHPALSVSLNNLFGVHIRGGDLELAEQLARRALSISETALGPDHPDVAYSLSNVGLSYDARGLYDDAEPLFRRALALREAALGPEHPIVAWSLTNIGVILDYRHEHEEALAMFDRALAIREKTFGRDHPETAFSLTNLGLVHERRGDDARARASFERALAIREAAYGPEHELVAVSLTNIGIVRTRQGELDEAQRLLERALSIREASRDGDDPSVAYTLDKLAHLHAKRGDHQQALALYERSMAIGEHASGGHRRSLAYTLDAIGDLHLDRGDLDAAESAYRRALEVRASLPYADPHGSSYPHIGLARVALARNQPEAAIEPLERALALDGPYTAPALSAQAHLLLAKALLESGRDPSRAITLARAARDHANAGGPTAADELAEAEQWLRKHDRQG